MEPTLGLNVEPRSSGLSMDSPLGFVVYIFTIAVLSGYAGFMLHYIIAICYGWRWLHSFQTHSIPSHSKDYQGVSIIKPLIGFDLNMKENLESYFQLDYPNFEIIFCIAETDNKPVLGVLKELMTQYPSVPASIFQGGVVVGINPKINNMLPGYKSAVHQLIWISDSNVKTPPDALLEMTRHLSDPKVGLVHQLPYVNEVKSFPGYVEKVYFGTQHARVYLLGTLASQYCANGMSWLIRKQALEQEGGLDAFSEYLAEDFHMGKAIWKKGWKLVLSTLPARQNPALRSLCGYQARIIRWGRLRATMMPWPGLLEPLTESICLGTIGSLCVYSIFCFNPLIFFLLHMTLWFFLDLILIRIVEHGSMGSLWCIFFAWCLREVWTIPLFFAGVWSREVAWKGQRYRIQFGGKAIKLD